MTRWSFRVLWRRFRAASRVRIMSYALLVSLLCGVTGFLEPLDDFARNIRYSLRHVPADGSIVVVGIDQKSARELGGKFPWPRTVDAQLIENLKAAGVGKIVFDRSFSDEDSAKNDAVLVATLKRYRGDVYFGSGVLAVSRDVVTATMIPAEVYRPHVKVGTFLQWTNPIGQMAELFTENRQGNARFPALSVVLSRKAAPEVDRYRPDFAIRSTTFPTFSYSDIVLKRAKPDDLAGRDVIVGLSEAAFGDSHFLPGQGRTQGAFAHAIGAQTLKRGTPVDLGWVPPVLFATIAALLLLLTAQSVRLTTAASMSVLAALFGLPVFLDERLISVDIAPATLLFTIVLIQYARLTFGWRKSRMHEPSGLPNVVALREVRGRQPMSLIAMRVDNHAAITASFAKDVEPLIACEIVGRLRIGDDSTEVYQGDEGVYYLLSPIIDNVLLSEHLDGLSALFSQPVRVGERAIDVAVTFGVDNTPGRAMASRIGSALLSAEDARRLGQRWKLYDEARGANAVWELAIGSEIDCGLDAGQFWLAYQPKLDLRTNAITGAEALLRWSHPQRGAISPAEFIAAAERDHRIERLTRFVFERAMHDAKRLGGATLLSLALNVSVPVLRRPDFADYVIDLVARHGHVARQFTVEVTESVYLAAGDDIVVENLRKLGAAGFGIAIDDFGTGHSTFESVQRIPATEVKIDQVFVRSMGLRSADRIIVESIIAMARRMKCVVVAEGVEDAATLAELREMGCDQVQGFLVAKPQPFGVFLDFVRRRSHRTAA